MIRRLQALNGSKSRATDMSTTAPSATRPLLLPMICFGTLGLGAVGWVLIDIVQGRELTILLRGQGSMVVQLTTGAAYGGAVGLLTWWVTGLSFLSGQRDRYVQIGALIQRPLPILLVSACAGISEEILFRGAIQYWLGIYATAVVFILVHGYVKPGNWRLILFGIALTITTIPLGFIADAWGLAGPILAHTVSDIVLFSALSHYAASSRS